MDARDLRVSDAEREHVGQLLQRAVGQGMLSLGEFTERMDTALSAKTRGELNVVLADLPGMRIRGDHTGVPSPVRGPVHVEPGSGAVDVIGGQMSSVVRKGPWHVAERIRVSTRMSSVALDFTEAVISSNVVEIELDDFCSSVTLIVPVGSTVDLNGVQLVGASIKNKVRTAPPGSLHIVVRGRLRFGSVTAKHPSGWKRLLSQG
ncbi:DUF1707 domain-containing protein [Antrihabitans sp. YC2-6]|uniref:DUF1707 SHOCT-like domain-containing protein n=1 Tax=Antrihabitans sp. YC2-6 TaxID=2799498 RepID=UPI0018F6F0CF|nr:DUF1707 domain-containing protein [Antrihabitans sp. YC2-6]MBJ8347700.1 DUF1707 domain-containing protein [Antrihabitans sp. YC2-6]